MDPMILRSVAEYYTAKLDAAGPTPAGVDWNSEESQLLRFAQLLRICEGAPAFSLLDYGCGYGALLGYARREGIGMDYHGLDISPAMLEAARRIHGHDPRAAFHARAEDVAPVDFTVASGIFNVKGATTDEAWHAYMLETVEQMAGLSRRGFAFNALTLYSDVEKRRPDLYYADPLFWFDRCKRRYSKRVALLHDTPLWEWTLLVRSDRDG